MVRAGDRVKWMSPLDADYSYGTILEINKAVATVEVTIGYHARTIAEVHLKHIRKLKGGGEQVGKCKKYRK